MSVDRDDVTRTLAGLVRINSINPAFGEGRTNESEIAWHVAALLSGLVQRTFPAIVTDVDERGARVQLCDLPIVSRIDSHNVEPGDDVRVKVVSTDIPQRSAKLERVA